MRKIFVAAGFALLLAGVLPAQEYKGKGRLLGTNYYNNSKFEDALKFYAKAVEKQKNSTDALYQLGLTYLNLQRNADSIAAFEDYLKVVSESPRAGQVRAFLDFLRKK